MAMSTAEQAMFSDIVTLVNRTDQPLEFKFDSIPYTIEAHGKKNLPRFIAEHACACNATAYNQGNYPTGSFFGIEASKDWPTDAMTAQEVKDIENSDKFGDEVIEGTTIIKKTRVSLRPEKKTFQENNIA